MTREGKGRDEGEIADSYVIAELDEGFFEPSLSDVQSYHATVVARSKRLNDAPLLTSKHRDEERLNREKKKADKWPNVSNLSQSECYVGSGADSQYQGGKLWLMDLCRPRYESNSRMGHRYSVRSQVRAPFSQYTLLYGRLYSPKWLPSHSHYVSTPEPKHSSLLTSVRRAATSFLISRTSRPSASYEKEHVRETHHPTCQLWTCERWTYRRIDGRYGRERDPGGLGISAAERVDGEMAR